MASVAFLSCRPLLVGGRVGFQEFLEVLQIAASAVGDSLLVVLWIPEECGVASDADTLNLVGGAVHLGDDNIVETLNVLTELSPDGSEGLAVAAPWSVVLYENILGLVSNDILPIATDNNLDWSIVHLWDRLRFKEWFEVTILELLNELTDVFKS